MRASTVLTHPLSQPLTHLCEDRPDGNDAVALVRRDKRGAVDAERKRHEPTHAGQTQLQVELADVGRAGSLGEWYMQKRRVGLVGWLVG